MSNALPRRIRPFRLARAGGSLAGRMPIAGMPRLAESLASESPHNQRAEVSVALRFERDERGSSLVQGRVRAVLELVCQRCLGAMEFPVDNEVHLEVLSREEDAVRFEEGYEPLLVEGESMALATLVEDELILGLPAYPAHPHAECATAPEYRAPEHHDDVEPEPEEQRNPFAVLRHMRQE